MQSKSWIDGFLSSSSMILVSEIGDKTFFIACLMAMRYNRLTVYIGALSALAVMTVLSAFLGVVVPQLISVRLTKLISAALFFIFGFKILYEEFLSKNDDEEDEMAEAAAALRERELNAARNAHTGIMRWWSFCSSPVLVEAFSLTFLAEWGDRSQIATIVLAAARNPYAVTVGAIAGHSICTGMAVISGGMIAERVSSRTINFIGGCLFILFGVVTLVDANVFSSSSSSTSFPTAAPNHTN